MRRLLTQAQRLHWSGQPSQPHFLHSSQHNKLHTCQDHADLLPRQTACQASHTAAGDTLIGQSAWCQAAHGSACMVAQKPRNPP